MVGVRPGYVTCRVCLKGRCHAGRERMELLRIAASAAEKSRQDKVYLDLQGRSFSGPAGRTHKLSRRPKVLLFRNIFNSPDKERNQWFGPGALYLASALKRSGYEVVLSGSKISLKDGEFITQKDELADVLAKNPDIDLIAVSLCEAFFEKAEKLIGFLRKNSRAFIGVGGVMPTLTPQHVFAHLPAADFLVRGAGESILPRIAGILAGSDIGTPLSEGQIKGLLDLEGFVFQNGHVFISASLNRVNTVGDYDESVLDFGFLDRDNLAGGLNLFSSRGCFNSCFFCTSPGRGKYTGKSFSGLKSVLADYRARIGELFVNAAPADARGLSFNDDDFIADRKRSRLFFEYMHKSRFRINFFQTGVNSFFKRRGQGYSDILDRGLLKELDASIFSAGGTNIYIGTENFSDRELARLNKGYDFSKISRVVEFLSQKKIYQAHHFILSNQSTSLEEVFDNLFKIASLRAAHGKYFNILVPIIPYLVSLFPSASYRMVLANGRKDLLNVRKILSAEGYPEYDYPLVDNDIPVDKLVRAMVPVIQNLFLSQKDYSRIFDLALVNLLLLADRSPEDKKRIRQVAGKYAGLSGRLKK